MKKSIFIAILSLFTLSSVFGQSFTTTTVSVSTDTICAGSSVTLNFTATNPTGTATSSKFRVEFANNSAMSGYTPIGTTSTISLPAMSTTPIQTFSATIPVVASGLYYIRMKMYNGITDVGITVPVTPFTIYVFNSLTTPTITTSGSTALCPSSTVTLTASGGSAPYLWSPGGATTPSITVSSANVYTVSSTNTCGTVTSSGVSVTNLSLPVANITATGVTTFCQGNNVVLTSSSTGATSTIWSTGSTGSLISANVSGTYYTIASNSCGTDTSNFIIVLVHTNPVAPVITQSGTDSLFSSYPTNNVWSTSNTTNYLVPTSSGTYSVTYTDVNGCSSISLPFSFTMLTTGIADIKSEVINVYPVPANDILNIELVNNSSKTLVSIYSVDGKKVLSSQIENSDKATIDVSDINPGIYILEVISDNQRLTKSIVVAH